MGLDLGDGDALSARVYNPLDMRLGPYELIRQLGAGGMAEVWLARRAEGLAASKTFALKRLARHLADKPEYREMFLAEARLSMLLSHSNIVQVFDAGEDQGEVFLAMEWIDGIDLAELGARLREQGERLSVVAAAYVVAEVLTALAYAHDLRDEAGQPVTVVHRDVSPQNVMLSVSGEVKLMDFGIARLSSEETSGLHIKGKVRYMPPEQLRGDSRAPTIDLFALGAILHELLDGERFRGQAQDESRLYGMVLDGEIPDPLHADEIPPELEVLRQRLLAEDVEDRIQSAQEALECLYRWPGFRNAKLEIAALVKRLRGVEAPSAGATTVIASAAGGEARTELVAPSFAAKDDEPGVSRTELLVDDQGPERSRTALLEGHGQARLDEVENPATGRRARAKATELDDTQRSERDATARARREPEPGEPRRRGGRMIGVALLGVLGVGGVGFALASSLGWFASSDPTTRDEESSEPPVDETRHARVLGDSFSGYAGFRHDDMLALSKLGIEYEYRDEPSSGERLAALADGSADFALASLDRVLLERPAGKIVAIVDLSMGADALVLDTVHHPELRELVDIPQMLAHGDAPALAYVGGSSSEYLLMHLDATLAVLDRHDLRLSSEFDDAAAVWRALEDPAGPVALGLLWEPWVSKARHAGMTVAVSTRDFPHAIVDVLVASDRVLAEDPELVDELVLAYYRRAIAQHRDPRRLREQLAAESALEREELERVLAGLCILSPLGAEPWFVGQPAPPDGQARPALLDKAITHTWATLSLAGMTQGKLGSPGDHYDPRAVQNAAADTRELLADSGVSALGIEGTCLESSAPPSEGAGEALAELGPLGLPASSILEQAWFEPGAASPSVALDELFSQVAATLAELNPATMVVRVVGYGDRPGSTARRLGARRATAIAEGLQARGVAVELVVEGRELGEGPARGIDFELLRRPEL
ncbi:MAG: protein kinase [Enhygromyxa sp.]